MTNGPVEIDLSPDLDVLGFTAMISVIATLASGLAPALWATRVGAKDALKEHGRGVVPGSNRFRLGKGLAVVQIAVSFVLVLGAALFSGTLQNLLDIDLGFEPQGVLMAGVNVQRAAELPQERVEMQNEILDRLQNLPGVKSASASALTPIGSDTWNEWIEPGGYGDGSGSPALLFMNRVSPGYFRTLRTPFVSGRDFNNHDDLSAPLVMVINESAARRFFGAADPLQRTIRMGNAASERRYQVIGVVKDSNYRSVGEEALIGGFLVMGQDRNSWPYLHYQIRHTGSLAVLSPVVRAALAEVSPEISLRFWSFETQVNESLQQQRLVALLSAFFGALALLLSMVGLYGLTSYGVARQQSEIGVRMTLGAHTGSVVWLVLRDVVVLLVAGTAVGALVALASGRLVTNLLYGVAPNDPVQMPERQ